MNEKDITVFTPTYNRGKLLQRLYESLCKQTNQNFIWIIIDDGSTDETSEIVKKFILDEKINIEYLYQKNSGKHVAHNKAVKMAKTELFFCVDSDDYLTDKAIQLILEKWNSVEHKDNIGGIVAYRGYDETSIIGNVFPNENGIDSLTNLHQNGKVGDTALIFRTDVLREYPFPCFENEKFLRESIAYDMIDKKYNLIILKKIIYIGEYLSNGLSKNATNYEMASPKGAALYRYNEFKKSKDIISKFRQYGSYLYFSIKGYGLRKTLCNVNFFVFIVFIPIIIIGDIRYKFILRRKR